MQKPMVLIILDGWGLAPPGPGNAISQAKLTVMPHLWNSYPHAQLAASGEAVGLPPGEDGNTETGHINLGAGRVVPQDLPRINKSIEDKSFFSNEAFIAAISYARQHKSNLHLMGLVSDAGVHSKLEHLFALLELAKAQKCDCPVYLHLFADGRDSPPKSSLRFFSLVEAKCKELEIGTIATVMGRFYAMDRDRRWERTEKAYNALTQMIERRAPSAQSAIEQAYLEKKTDEFIEPTIIVDKAGTPYPRIANHDAVIFFNFRVDRPRQLTKAFILPDFEAHGQAVAFDPYAVKYFHKHVVEEDTRSKPFVRAVVLPNIFMVTMTEYERNLPCMIAFPSGLVKMPLGRVIADNGLRQLRVSETEKERFVGYYFNGMREDPFPGEERLIIPSPKVATYDTKPEMAALELTQKVQERLRLGAYALTVINFANPDMVAHTGNIPPAIRACEVTDMCVGAIVAQVMTQGGSCVITADHGNVEEMLGPNGEIDTEHSTFPVPFIFVDHIFEQYPFVLPNGKLADVAPTILSFMHMSVPSEMTGKNLLQDVPLKGVNI